MKSEAVRVVGPMLGMRNEGEDYIFDERWTARLAQDLDMGQVKPIF